MQENPTDAKYEISRAIKVDLAAIARIYNASVLERNATAALHPVDIEEREAWFDAHEAANRPIYVLREICEENLAGKDGKADCERKFGSNGKNLGAQKIGAANQKGEILAWGSLSVYVAPGARGKGLGGQLVNFMLKRAPELGVKNIVALIFSSNAASLNLFAKFSFARWGELPAVCDMCGKPESLTIPGKKLGQI